MTPARVLCAALLGISAALAALAANAAPARGAAAPGAPRAETSDRFSDGAELLSLCAAKGDFGSGACLGYIIGALDAFTVSQQRGFCAPAGLRRGDVRDLVVAWLTAHPEKRATSGAAAVYNAMADAYPCARK